MQVNCLRYCSFVHLHHRHEDVHLFPALRASDPSLEPVVDRLESDHREVAVQLEEIEAAVAALGEDDDKAGRHRVVAALQGLGELLLAHLDYEEESIGPTLLGWSAWPS
jgi:hemerythrin-like domain-containing protein